MNRPPSLASRRARALRRLTASHPATALALLLAGFNAGFLATGGLLALLEPVSRLAGASPFQRQLLDDIGLIQILLAAAFLLGLARPEMRVGLWSAATLCLAAQATLLGTGTLSALLVAHGALLSLWAIGRATATVSPLDRGTRTIRNAGV